jgi:membrane protein
VTTDASDGASGGEVRNAARAFLPGAADCRRALRRTPVSIWNDDVTDWAAALTYYAVLAIFPALLVTVSATGLAGADATQQLITRVTTVLPAESGELMAGALKDMAGRRGAAWLLAVFGTAASLWSASSYLSVFRRALHAMHGVQDHRPVWRTVPRIVLTALALLALLVSSVFVLVLSGELARTAGSLLGMDDVAADAWNTAKWPLLLCLAAVLVLVLFRTGPPGTRGVRNRVPGGAVAVLLWLVASLGFALYATRVGTYHRMYGSLAGIVVFLIWLWMSNLALLSGAQFNAELLKLRAGRRS